MGPVRLLTALRRRFGGMPADFLRLWTGNAISSLGDGATAAAAPLLTASITSDPRLIAGAAAMGQVPYLVLSLPAGVLVDRFDKRRICMAADAVRVISTGILAILVATGHIAIPLLYLLLVVEGIASIADRNAGQSLIPALVSPELLPRANARLQGSATLFVFLVGPPLGAALFLASHWTPFAVDAASFLLSLTAYSRVRWREPARERSRARVWTDAREGLGWLWRHTALRTLAVCICVMNLTFGGVIAVLVVYAHRQLHTGAGGYGALLTATAIGGLIGSAGAARLEARFGMTPLLRVGLTIEALTHVGLALSHSLVPAYFVLVAFGVHAVLWNVVTSSLQQRVTPAALRGRTNGAYTLFSVGGHAVGALLGGVFVHEWGITAPFWISAAVVGLLVLLAWRPFALTDVGRAPARAAAQPE